MFAEHDFKYIPLILALLAYLGAVRIAIRQRLGALLVEMHKEHNEHTETDNRRAQWFALHKHARRKSRALMLLIPADVMFVGVAAFLAYELLPWQVFGSLTIPIEAGIMLGAAYLLLLHVGEWCWSYGPATKPYPAPVVTVDVPPRPEKFPKDGRFNGRWRYVLFCVIPLLVLAGLCYWSTSLEQLFEKDAEDHYGLGSELYEQGRFDAAIVQHQHAIHICDFPARYHYALAQALAKRNAQNSPLAALQKAIKREGKLAAEAKNETAFESLRSDAALHDLVGGPSADGNK